MSNKTGRNDRIYISALLIALLTVSVQPAEDQNSPATSVQNTPAQIHALKVTLLSTMLVGSTTGLGEWGFCTDRSRWSSRAAVIRERTLIPCFKMHAI